jgi:hypothetical protein
MRNKPHLQRAHKRTCDIFDQMRQTIVRHRFPPMA